MDPSQVFNPISVQGGIALLTPYILEWMKRSPLLPFLTRVTTWRVRLLSMVTALATSVGIGFSYDANVGQLVVTGLTFSAVFQLLFQAAVQFAVQHTVYEAAIKPEQSANRLLSMASSIGAPGGVVPFTMTKALIPLAPGTLLSAASAELDRQIAAVVPKGKNGAAMTIVDMEGITLGLAATYKGIVTVSIEARKEWDGSPPSAALKLKAVF